MTRNRSVSIHSQGPSGAVSADPSLETGGLEQEPLDTVHELVVVGEPLPQAVPMKFQVPADQSRIVGRE
jgi:hypothetical protein